MKELFPGITVTCTSWSKVPTLVTSEWSIRQLLEQDCSFQLCTAPTCFCRTMGCWKHLYLRPCRPWSKFSACTCTLSHTVGQFWQRYCFIHQLWLAIAVRMLGFPCFSKILVLWFCFHADLDVLKYNPFAEFHFTSQNERAFTTPQENRVAVRHQCCLLHYIVKKYVGTWQLHRFPQVLPSQALHAAPFMFGNCAVKDAVF